MPAQYRTSLERIMTQSGRTGQWLADQLGVTRSAVSRYMSGDRRMSDETIALVAEILDVPEIWLRMEEPVVELEPAS